MAVYAVSCTKVKIVVAVSYVPKLISLSTNKPTSCCNSDSSNFQWGQSIGLWNPKILTVHGNSSYPLNDIEEDDMIFA